MQMDKKEAFLLQHYKKLIENRKFVEYDILGFLILIRRHIRKPKGKYDSILEFADLIAHRQRDQGTVMNCIATVHDKGEPFLQETNTVEGYAGIESDELTKELECACADLGISVDQIILKEMCMCIFSLAQFSKYKNKKGDVEGTLYLFQANNNNLALGTSNSKDNSAIITFSTISGVKHVKSFFCGFIDKPVEAVRHNGKLKLRCNGDWVCELSVPQKRGTRIEKISDFFKELCLKMK